MNKEVKEYAIEKTKELIDTPTRGGNGRGEEETKQYIAELDTLNS